MSKLFFIMNSLVKEIFSPFLFHYKFLVLILIFCLGFTMLFGQEVKTAYVNKAKIYQGYNLFLQYHSALVKELEEADMDNSAKILELDASYKESVVTAGENSALESKRARDMEMVHETQLDYIRELLGRYDKNVARCEANIQEVIDQIVKEAGYTNWELIESEETRKDRADITAEVLLRLNK
jgi:Skp family chaperone for outer membrane proteins